jgi:hypothetical protein
MAAARKAAHAPTTRQRTVRERNRQASPSQRGSTAADAAPPLDAVVREALAAAGLLGAPPAANDLPTDPAARLALEQEIEDWLDSLTEPLGLAEAVIEDRQDAR